MAKRRKSQVTPAESEVHNQPDELSSDEALESVSGGYRPTDPIFIPVPIQPPVCFPQPIIDVKID
jgi:hypothetical protein